MKKNLVCLLFLFDSLLSYAQVPCENGEHIVKNKRVVLHETYNSLQITFFDKGGKTIDSLSGVVFPNQCCESNHIDAYIWLNKKEEKKQLLIQALGSPKYEQLVQQKVRIMFILYFNGQGKITNMRYSVSCASNLLSLEDWLLIDETIKKNTSVRFKVDCCRDAKELSFSIVFSCY